MNKNKYLIDLSASPKTDFGRVEFEKQTSSQKVFSAIWALESEVNSVGFSNYLNGSDSDTAEFAPIALKEIGAFKCASIVEKALQVGPDGDLDELDGQFYAYPDNLTDLLFEFVASHPETFGTIGSTD